IKALELIERAVVLAPERADYLAQRARCLALLHRDAEAGESVALALRAGPRDALCYDTLGVVATRLGHHEQAAQLFEEALRRDPANAGHAYNLAAAQRFLGHFEAAEAAYERAICNDPRLYRAHWALSGLRRQTAESNHLERLETLLREVPDVDGELYLRHALAKELEDL